MRKNKSSRNNFIIAAVIAAIGLSILTVSCVRTEGAENARSSNSVSKKIVEIKEKMFLAHVNDIYTNARDYLEKTIKLEGIFSQLPYNEETFCFVFRYGPGCCVGDGYAGFEVTWAKENAQPYPENDSWVEATGELNAYERNGYPQYLYLDLSSLNVLNTRGEEFVTQ